MFWRSVVGKLAVTILLLVSFVLFVLTILLLEFFETFHIAEAEKAMMQTANKVSIMYEQYHHKALIEETVERVKDPDSRVAVVLKDKTVWFSKSQDKKLSKMDFGWFSREAGFSKIVNHNETFKEQVQMPENKERAILVGMRLSNEEGVVYVYQSLDVINQTKAETTKIIFLAAGIAIVLTTIFAFFLSTRITAPLIKMREAALDLARGKFDTKVPILTHDEIGELAIAFNRMGRQLKFNIDALSQEKEQLSSIVNSMADGIMTMNRKGDILVSNPPAERFFLDGQVTHVDRGEGIGRKIPFELNVLLDKIIDGEPEVIREIRVGGRNWVIIMTPLYDRKQVRGAVAVIRDMTEERRLDKLRKDFIANVSHELRTPISLLQGYSEAIVDGIADTKEEKNELAQIIHEESLRMGRLVNELLDIARMESGQIELNISKVKLEEFMERIYKKFQGIAQDNGVKLGISLDFDKAEASFDPDRVEQVFTNLIDNAIRHTGEDGRVSISASSCAGYFEAAVADNGSGIAEEDLPYVFERFYKADKSRTRNLKKKGTGLGLSIAKNIIDAHHGSITVKSELGNGTTFSFRIPYQA